MVSDKYPRGKLNENDEGAMPIAIYTQDNTVVIDFSKQVVWIGMDKDQAIHFAKSIMLMANTIIVN